MNPEIDTSTYEPNSTNSHDPDLALAAGVATAEFPGADDTKTQEEVDVTARVDATSADLSALHVALVSSDRPSRCGPLTASLVFGWRALLKIKHVPEQLFDVTVFPIMMVLMFTYLFGGALAGSVDNYIQFFLPGLLVQTVAMITMYTGVAINTDFSKGVMDRFRALPVWRPSALVGALMGDAVRFTLASTIMLVVGTILGFRPDGGIVGVVQAVLLLLVFAFCLGWAWTFLGLTLRTPESVMGTSMMFLFPLTFISNIFVDPETMPDWLQRFVSVNPITHVATSVRSLMHGQPDGSAIVKVLIWSAIFVAIFGPLAMRRYKRR